MGFELISLAAVSAPNKALALLDPQMQKHLPGAGSEAYFCVAKVMVI